jgi:hypothetical protein
MLASPEMGQSPTSDKGGRLPETEATRLCHQLSVLGRRGPANLEDLTPPASLLAAIVITSVNQEHERRVRPAAD